MIPSELCKMSKKQGDASAIVPNTEQPVMKHEACVFDMSSKMKQLEIMR